MDIRLPNGVVLKGVPEGTSKDEIMRKAIASGYATEADFGIQPTPSTQVATQTPVSQVDNQQMQKREQQEVSTVPSERKNPVRELGKEILGVGEIGLTMGTGFVNEALAGLAGLVSSPVEGADAGEIVTDLQGKLTYKPRTEKGKRNINAIGDFFAPVSGWFKDMGEASYELAKSPTFQTLARASNNPALVTLADNPELAGTLGETSAPAMLELLGLKGLSTVRSARHARKVIADEIIAGNRNIDNVMKAVDGNGRLTKNVQAKKVIELFDDDIEGKKASLTFEALTRSDRKAVSEMVDLIDEGRKKETLFSIENRPADVIGKQIQNKIQKVMDIKRGARDKLKEALPKLQKQQFDINEQGIKLLDYLEANDVGISRNPKRGYSLDFSDSAVNLGKGTGLSKSKLETVLNRLDVDSKNGLKVHRDKQFIQGLLDYNTANLVSKASPELTNLMKEIAFDLNQKLRNASKKYADANDIYSSSRDGLTIAQKYLNTGKTPINLQSEFAPKRLGNVAKRLASNFTSKEEVYTMLDELDKVLLDNKIPVTGNVKRQVATLSLLEDMFKLEKAQSPFGLGGRVETAIEMATNPVGTGVAKGASKALDSLKKWREPDFNQRIKLVKEVLNEQ